MTYEYKVIPAPTKGQKSKGLKAGEAKFALALETLMNELAREGWEYQRAETLPSVERAGLTSTTTEWRNLLVFRRLAVEAPMRAPDEPALIASRPPEPPATHTPQNVDQTASGHRLSVIHDSARDND